MQTHARPGSRGQESQAEMQPVIEAINRERAEQGKSPIAKLTVPLLKEHLRGKTVGSSTWRAGAKKRDELLGDFRCCHVCVLP